MSLSLTQDMVKDRCMLVVKRRWIFVVSGVFYHFPTCISMPDNEKTKEVEAFKEKMVDNGQTAWRIGRLEYGCPGGFQRFAGRDMTAL